MESFKNKKLSLCNQDEKQQQLPESEMDLVFNKTISS